MLSSFHVLLSLSKRIHFPHFAALWSLTADPYTLYHLYSLPLWCPGPLGQWLVPKGHEKERVSNVHVFSPHSPCFTMAGKVSLPNSHGPIRLILFLDSSYSCLSLCSFRSRVEGGFPL